VNGKVDPLFTLISEQPKLAEQYSLVQELCRQFKPFADENFESELQLQFVSRFWEMYLGCAFLNHGFALIPRKDRPKAGPDLCIVDKGISFWIEAVAPSSGDGPDSVPDPETQEGLVSEEKIVLRFCQAIKSKHEKHNEYIGNGLLKESDPFLVAVNGARIPNAETDQGTVPYPIQAVLPVGLPTVTIDKGTLQKVGEGFQYRDVIVKKSSSAVPTDIFLNPKYESMSGLLFSGVHPFYFQEVSLKPVSLLCNPLQKNHVPTGWLRAGREWWIEDHHLNLRIINPAA
jgi:type I restriction enzyme S subunit